MNTLQNANQLWQSVMQYCKNEISITAFNLWIEPIQLLNFKGGIATLNFTNEFQKDTVVGQYKSLLENAFESVCGFPVKVIYTCPEDNLTNDERAEQNIQDFKHETFTFDNFIVGDTNKFAYSSCKAVAADPGGQIKGNINNTYNPLFIYGNSGLGKTHLLNAISYEVIRNYPDMKVVYAKSEEFLNEFIYSVGNGTIDKFHEKYRNVDVLLIDDIQFIANKPQTEEEFFHTFNALKDNGKQIVLTSDRPPKEIHSLVDRLKNRFESGLLADIQPPEYETRCAIIKRKAEELNFELDDAIITFIAEKIKDNVRQLEGVTKKLHAFSLFGGETITIALAQQAISDVVTNVQDLPITIKHIVEEVSRTTGISVEDIYSKKHTAEVSDARKMCFYIIRQVTDLSFKNIGKEFGRDHTTVIYNVDKMGDKIKVDGKLNSTVSDIINNIKENQK